MAGSSATASKPKSTAPPEKSTGMRFRQAFKREDLDSTDYEDQVIFMDEQSQEELIQELIREDTLQNEFYIKLFRLITATSILYFISRYALIKSKGWVFNSDIFFIISLWISFCATPDPALQPTDPVVLPSAGGRQQQLQALNIGWSCIMCLWTWTDMFLLGNGEKPGYHEEYLCAFPFLIAVLGWVVRKMIGAVNFGELEHLQYRYMGA